MTKKQVKGAASYEGALLICQNLAELTAYEVAGDQVLIPDSVGSPSEISRSLILMPGVRLASTEMARGIATLGTSALGVRCLRYPDSERIGDFSVLFAENGGAERFAAMRAWVDQDHGLYLIPGEDAADSREASLKFDRGLRKVDQPWADEADRQRGLAEAMALLLAEGPERRAS
ncbi:hypothetical protein [Qipengyuania nanhaisediminis]|uniref:Uncharacterized protein n=1 Tax=Qipengyuania nanhaisediminis TaxID=604088 RepID=A0A1I5N3D8_9SPHN|nr:hypothetical protein [Qipengyuania nanhaisediminis]SFP16244.1 hypothetical protein SAMN04488060_1758 [Qipengyuania nanhaisediminis]